MSARLAWPARGVALLLLVLAPRLLGDFHLLLLTQILIFGLLALGLNLLVGYTGLPSLGHATYFGAGGYAAAIVAREASRNGFNQIAVAVLVALIVAGVTGFLAVRTRGIYFLMLTLAFAQLLFALAVSWDSVTGGSNGLAGIPRLRLWGDTTIREQRDLYLYVLCWLLVCYVALGLVVNSPFGRALAGIRENEGRMRAVGYPTLPYKLTAYCLAGALGGLAGALFVQHERFISPTNVSFEISVLALISVIVGGAGTLYGPLLGAAFVLLMRDELSTRFQERWELVLGLVFVGFVYFLPKGLGGLVSAGTRWIDGRGALTPGPSAAVAGEGSLDLPRTPILVSARTDRAPRGGSPLDEAPLSRDGGRGAGGEGTPPLLRLENVSKLYGSLRAVDDVTLTVAEGDRHAVIGPNGAGKSTLFGMVSGTVPVSSGRISFRGEEITRMAEYRRVRLGIGKTFQHSNVFDGLTVLENVALPVRRRLGVAWQMLLPARRYETVTRRSVELLETVGLAGRADSPAGALSHGERRQLEVAMALATEPVLLLLDEPTAGMSRAESVAFVEMIARLPASLTVLVIEHDIDVVFALANRITVMHVGRLLADGTPDEVRASAAVQEAYLGGERREELFEQV